MAPVARELRLTAGRPPTPGTSSPACACFSLSELSQRDWLAPGSLLVSDLLQSPCPSCHNCPSFCLFFPQSCLFFKARPRPSPLSRALCQPPAKDHRLFVLEVLEA